MCDVDVGGLVGLAFQFPRIHGPTLATPGPLSWLVTFPPVHTSPGCSSRGIHREAYHAAAAQVQVLGGAGAGEFGRHRLPLRHGLPGMGEGGFLSFSCRYFCTSSAKPICPGRPVLLAHTLFTFITIMCSPCPHFVHTYSNNLCSPSSAPPSRPPPC